MHTTKPVKIIKPIIIEAQMQGFYLLKFEYDSKHVF